MHPIDDSALGGVALDQLLLQDRWRDCLAGESCKIALHGLKHLGHGGFAQRETFGQIQCLAIPGSKSGHTAAPAASCQLPSASITNDRFLAWSYASESAYHIERFRALV